MYDFRPKGVDFRGPISSRFAELDKLTAFVVTDFYEIWGTIPPALLALPSLLAFSYEGSATLEFPPQLSPSLQLLCVPYPLHPSAPF